jgi:Zn-dependent peptidase ImmA (M78 family)
MQHSPRHLEGLARQIHDETNAEAPIDAFALAEACGLTLRPWSKAHAEIDLDSGVIRYPSRARIERQNFKVLHELAHAVLVRAHESDRDETDVDYLASALLLPRARFLADLSACDWDLDALKARHPRASYQAIVVRMTQLSDATASVWDAGKLHAVYGLHDTTDDRAIVDEALALERPVRGLLSAFPIIDGAYRRVLCVRRAA